MSRKSKASELHSTQTQQQTQTSQQHRLEQQVQQLQQQQQSAQQHFIQHAQATLQSNGAAVENHLLQSNFPALRKQNTTAGASAESGMAGTQGIHRSGSTIGQIPFAPGAPDMLYNSPDFKLLEERVVDQIRAVIHESELRTCRKFFEWIEWSNQQQAQALDAIRQELSLAYGPGSNNDEAETFAGTVHDGTQPSQDLQESATQVPNVFQASQQQNQQTTPGTAAAARTSAAVRMRTGASRGRRTGQWPGVQRSETFATPSPARAASYVPPGVSRAMTMPQGFTGSPNSFSRFNALDVSVLGGQLGTPEGSQLTSGAKRPPKLKTGTSTFAVAGSPAAVQQFKIPSYKLSRAIKTVQELWLEWTVGINGGPPVKQLEDMFKSSWRNGMAERQFFSRRKVLLDEVMKRGGELYEEENKKREERKQALLQQEALNPGSAAAELQKLEQEANSDEAWVRCHAQAAEDLDKERGRMSLNALSGKLRKQRHALNGTKGEYNEDGHQDDEDAEGEENDEDSTQMTDTQMTDSQLQTQLQQQSQQPRRTGDMEGEPMELEAPSSTSKPTPKKSQQSQPQRTVSSPNANGTQSQVNSQTEDPLTVIARDVISQQHHPRPHPHQNVPVLPSQPATNTTNTNSATSSTTSNSAARHALQTHLAVSLQENQSFSTADWDGFVGDLGGSGGAVDEEDVDGDGDEAEEEEEEEEVREGERASKKRRTE